MSPRTQTRAGPDEATHRVRFYGDDAALFAEVADFLDCGLRCGGTAIVIATADHLNALRRQLMGLGALQGQRNWFSGELIMVDAADALAQFMVDDWPDEQRFERVIGKRIRAACGSGTPVHAFGEMVTLLCSQGHYDAAVRLEQMWNTLQANCHFSLFCAYPWRLFPSESLASTFQKICSEHDYVCAHEHGEPDGTQDINVRQAILAQENLALKEECARMRESERTLRHREREFTDFLENAAEGLHRLGPDGTILWANKAELALLGYRWEDYIGHHLAEFHADNDVIDEILGKLCDGETLNDRHARLRCKDGSIKHVVINSNGCFENGRLRYTRCFTRDATERHLLEQAHRERESLVAELSRTNHAKDEFLAMLAHELRNPLAPISAAAHMLAVAAGDADRVQRSAAVIARQVGHMKGLIDDLLDVARITRGLVVLTKVPLDLRAVVAEAVEQATPHIHAHRHRLVLDLPPDAAAISGDRKRLVQVVANVINNAAKFTPDGGDIEVRLQPCAHDVRLTITDSGVGMEAGLAERAFDLFVQGDRTPDRAQGGLGIGLAVARCLVESHGGTVSAESEGPGTGSRFTICLPRLEDGPAGTAPASADTMAETPGQALRITVVDDNRDAADALATLLTAVGHDATALYSSASALEAAASDCPHVFLLDIGLPHIDGIALANRLRALPAAAGATFIAVTGYGQERDKALTRAAGFRHHLVKPVDTAELLDLLAAIARATAAGQAPNVAR